MINIDVPLIPPQLRQHGANDFRAYPVSTPPPPPPPPPPSSAPWLLYPPPETPIVLPLDAKVNGDSNTGGRGSSMFPTAESPHALLGRILVASGYTAYTAYASGSDVDSASGRSLVNTMTAAVNDTGSAGAWIHVEESGSQNATGQLTPLQYGDTFEAGWRAIHAVNPTALKTAANAPNFGRSPTERYRDWQFRNQYSYWGYASEAEAISYNEEMLRRIDILAADGIDIIPIFIAERADELAPLLPNGAADLYSDTNPYHWSSVGRLIQVMETLRCLGWDVNTLNFDTVDVHTNPSTSAAMKAACIQVINNVMGQY